MNIRQSTTHFFAKVQYSAFALSGLFVSKGDIDLSDAEPGTSVVVSTARGTELGKIMSRPKSMPVDSAFKGEGEMLRIASADDLEQQANIEEVLTENERKLCLNLIIKHKLNMHLVKVEHLLGGERVIFHFKSENRVDFRSLVRDLAYRLKTRIEMHQIGGRDEARMLGCFGLCGRELCCKSFLSKIPSVSMRSVKTQFPTVNAQKTCGICGHLRCCLKYEEDGYRELQARLPATGSFVEFNDPENGTMRARVVGHDILNQILRVRTEDDDKKMLNVPLTAVIKPDKHSKKRNRIENDTGGHGEKPEPRQAGHRPKRAKRGRKGKPKRNKN